MSLLLAQQMWTKDQATMRGLNQRRLFAGLCLLLWQAGCAAFHPVHGVPSRYLPTEMKVGDRSNRRTIDLSLLRQTPPLDANTGNVIHRIDAGDVLGIYVEGFVGKHTDPPPVYFPTNNDVPPSFGLPFPVREDGTVSLPEVGSVNLRGLTMGQAEERVRQAYLNPRQLIKPESHRVQVNLQRPRQYRVLVIRQDSRSEPTANAFLGQLNIGVVKRGTGKVVNLPVYSNDVLNALTATDGLPGLDAENAVYVIRRRGNSVGGALDPRWPTDLVPTTTQMRSPSDAPVIRAQSPGSNAGYYPGGNYPEDPRRVIQARYIGPVNVGVQQIGNGPATGLYGGHYGPADRADSNQSIEPPKVWADRPNLSPMAFDSQSPPGSIYPVAGGPTPIELQSPKATLPALSSQPGWNGPGSAPQTGLNFPAAEAYRQPQGSGPAPYGQPPEGPVSQPYSNSPPFNSSQSTNSAPGLSFPNNGNYGSAPRGSDVGTMPSAQIAPMGPYSPAMPNWQPGPEGALLAPGIPAQSGSVPTLDPGHGSTDPGVDGRHVIRIPIRLGPGETADIRPEDVVLYDGDIVFIESRDTEVFYTGGLLGGGQFTLPRDYDLNILQALSLAQSRGVSGGVSRAIGGVSSLNSDVAISPSTAIVLRKLPDGSEIPIKINLYRARTDLSERIVIQPGDFILLQYTPLEAVAAFFERHLLETAIFGLATQQFTRGGSN